MLTISETQYPWPVSKGETASLISRISQASDRYGDLLVKFMARYGLNGLKDAKEWQLREFINTEKRLTT